MGKRLIVLGADFSTNAIPQEYTWETPEAVKLSSTIINANGSLSTNNSITTYKYSIEGYDAIRLNGTSRMGSAGGRYAFYNGSPSSSTLISIELGDDSSPNVNYNNEVVNIPSGAQYLCVTKNGINVVNVEGGAEA